MLPVKDAIYFSNGDSFHLRIQLYPTPVLHKGDSFSLISFYKENENEITNIDILKEVKLSNGFYCCVGDGSYGSEGFVACLDEKRNLLWVVYSEISNPFISAFENDFGYIIAKSSAEFKLKICIRDPRDMSLI